MTKLTLAQMRAKFAEQDSKRGNFTGTGDKAAYKFWDIPENSTATVRFLPDGNDDNSFFWVRRITIKMPFSGTKGESVEKPLNITVPCAEAYGKKCPVQEEIKSLGWWKGSDEEQALARTYYKSSSYLYQGFVVNSPLKEETLPENPIRRFTINKSVHDKIHAGLMDPDIEDMPTDYVNGLDFRITKTKQGKYASYDTSGFARRSRALNEEELAAIEKFGLFDLVQYLPKTPDDATLKLIFELFEDSVNGELFDPEKYKIFKPFTPNASKTASKDEDVDADDAEEAVVVETKPQPKVQAVVEPKVNKFAETSVSGPTPKLTAQEILANIQKKKKEKENQ